jgi:aspartyl-tRNA(Asn)/glutamyl-tRNA(Gln) amidotransferase subunit B
VERAIRFGLAIGAQVAPRSIFARKNYFYPDLPKGYQISQFDEPLATKGSLEIVSEDRGPLTVGITRLHLEEDAGKSFHDKFAGLTAVDLNRSGVPLIEIVSEPDLRSPAEARAYLTALKQVLRWLGVSDCNMEEGSLRVDANLSIRRPGDPLGTRTEVKNMNSFSGVERALTVERARQVALVESGGAVEQHSMTFDAARGEVRIMRSKEESHDYRYFPEPDLPPLRVDRAWLDALRAELPELPSQRRARYRESLGLSAYDAAVIVADPVMTTAFEAIRAAAAVLPPKEVANLVTGDYGRAAKEIPERGPEGLVGRASASQLADLLRRVSAGDLSRANAKEVLAEHLAEGTSVAAIVDARGLRQISDAGALGSVVDQVLAANPAAVADYRAGKGQAVGFLVGQVMKATRGQANAAMVGAVLRERLGAVDGAGEG